MKEDKTRSFNMDCMDFMKDVPDKFYTLAIVDPPYGIARFGERIEKHRIDKKGKINSWDKKPKKEYFEELFRVSKNQIVWGANNYVMPPSEYFCIWHKKQTVNNFASAEYAWVSMGLKKPAQVFEFTWAGMLQQDMKNKEDRIHPTQKPVKLYEWILINYAKEGDKILDTHGGSQSSRIACFNLGFELDIIELDKEYYEAGNKRFEQHKSQLRLF